MVITFIGHRDLYIDNNLKNNIKKAIKENLIPNEKILFYCGGYGNFDNLCAEICHSLKNEIQVCEVIFITPYITEAQQKNIKYLIDIGLYDSTLYPPLENIPPKFAITKRNEWIIDNADLIIAYVDRDYGGAYKTLNYARKKKKPLINLAE